MYQKITTIIVSILLAACSATLEKPLEANKTQEVKLPEGYLNLSAEEQKDTFELYWKAISRVEPRFPISAARNSLSGCTKVLVGVDASGKAEFVKVVGSYPKKLFDNASINAIKLWRWKAGDKNQTHAPALTTIELNYILHGAKNMSDVQEQCNLSST